MKKYLMTGIAAVALGGLFVGCNNYDDLSGGVNSTEFNIVQNYENAFITRFGQPDSAQTWGFGEAVAGTRSGNTGAGYEKYPATHEYTDANGNVIAGANMNHNEWADPDKEYGGWLVPDALTEGQKLRVQKYFQANPNLSYQDPHYANFFVQQVYTGGTSTPETGNKESTKAADGTVHAGSTLNQLTVGAACSHINDFNAGTCTPSNVLDNGSNVNNGTYHSDQITLMVNVDDTSCFGYHETGGSNVKGVINHNDKMALVSAATIDAWAAANGNPGEAVVDKWNRSFMGFDYELLPESDIVLDSYATLNAVPNLNNIPYAWDGEKIMTIGEAPEAPEPTPREEFDLTPYFAENSTGENVGGGTVDCNIVDGKIVCSFKNQWYNSITFKQRSGADWTSYDKLVIEFDEPSPVALTLSCNGEAAIAVGATSVEVATVDYVYDGNGGPSISGGTGSEQPVTLTIKKVTLVKEATTPVVDTSIIYYNPTYLLGDDDADKISFYSTNTNMYGGIVRNVTEDEMKTTKDGKTCLDLTFFQGLVADGYHPISTDLKKWVKWQAACDGYYSDWIVTLTKAERITTPPTPPTPPDTPQGFLCRVIAEDLTVNESTDFDFNDVVFDVFANGVIRVRACGGTLPLRVDGQEVHGLFEKSTSEMINTGWNGSIDPTNTYRDIKYSGGTIADVAAANDILVEVQKGDQWIPLVAPVGQVASKIAVGEDYPWCSERQDIDTKWHLKDGTKTFSDYVRGNIPSNEWYRMVIEEAAKYQNKKNQ